MDMIVNPELYASRWEWYHPLWRSEPDEIWKVNIYELIIFDTFICCILSVQEVAIFTANKRLVKLYVHTLGPHVRQLFAFFMLFVGAMPEQGGWTKVLKPFHEIAVFQNPITCWGSKYERVASKLTVVGQTLWSARLQPGMITNLCIKQISLCTPFVHGYKTCRNSKAQRRLSVSPPTTKGIHHVTGMAINQWCSVCNQTAITQSFCQHDHTSLANTSAIGWSNGVHWAAT